VEPVLGPSFRVAGVRRALVEKQVNLFFIFQTLIIDWINNVNLVAFDAGKAYVVVELQADLVNA